MWEDSQNKRGGRWLITLAKQQRHTELDRFWLDTVSVAPLEGPESGVPPTPGLIPRGDCARLPFSLPTAAVPHWGDV